MKRTTMKKTIAIGVIVLTGLAGVVGGCDNGNGSPFPPGILGYSYIDTSSYNDTLPQAAFDGTNSLVVYDEIITSSDHNIIGAFVDQTGNALSYVNIETAATDDQAPQVAFDGANYLVVYQEDNGADHDIMGVFVSPISPINPMGLVGTPFPIDTSSNDDLTPAVAFNGTDYLVAYQRAVSGTNGDIVGAVVDTTGAVLAGSPFTIDASADDDIAPAVASNGTTFLVAYQRVAGRTSDDIMGAIVDPAVSATPPAVTLFNIDASTYDDQAPAVASDGTNYLVAYQEVFSTDRDIVGSLVTVAGTPTATFIPIDTFTGTDDYQPRVAWGGTRYLVAYTETYSSTDHDILGARITPAGKVQSRAFAIDTTPNDDFSPAVVFGATSYLVPYQEMVGSSDNNIIGALVKP